MFAYISPNCIITSTIPIFLFKAFIDSFACMPLLAYLSVGILCNETFTITFVVFFLYA